MQSALKGQEGFVMTGHILASDGEDTTYLTLQSPLPASIPLEARTRVTAGGGTGYNPMSIHPRGDTVHKLALGELHDDGIELGHVDSEGKTYALKCLKVRK